jgi:hypothetical protein
MEDVFHGNGFNNVAKSPMLQRYKKSSAISQNLLKSFFENI